MPDGPPATPPQVDAEPDRSSAETLDHLAGLSFEAFLDESYVALLVRQPESLTSLGVASWYGLRNDRLNDLSPEHLAETQRLEEGILGLLRQYDRDTLPPDSRVSYDVYEWWLALQVDGACFPGGLPSTVCTIRCTAVCRREFRERAEGD